MSGPAFGGAVCHPGTAIVRGSRMRAGWARSANWGCRRGRPPRCRRARSSHRGWTRRISGQQAPRVLAGSTVLGASARSPRRRAKERPARRLLDHAARRSGRSDRPRLLAAPSRRHLRRLQTRSGFPRAARGPSPRIPRSLAVQRPSARPWRLVGAPSPALRLVVGRARNRVVHGRSLDCTRLAVVRVDGDGLHGRWVGGASVMDRASCRWICGTCLGGGSGKRAEGP
jgi:hypothetical protein